MDSLAVTREEFRLEMNKLLEFLAQGLGGVPGTFTTENVDPLALLLAGAPKLLQSATPLDNDETTRVPSTEWVRKKSGMLGPAQSGFRNILINGTLGFNQRNVAIAAAAVGSYGPDRWKRTAGGMTQIVEEGGYVPNRKYTLSGNGVTTQVLTSPISGHWTLPNMPITANYIQLEQGEVATAFEVRPLQLELAMCQRYYQNIWVSGTGGKYPAHPDGYLTFAASFAIMRTAPTIASGGVGHADIISGVNQAQMGATFGYGGVITSRATSCTATLIGILQAGVSSSGTFWAVSYPVKLDAEL
jgi:hypothetical protein